MQKAAKKEQIKPNRSGHIDVPEDNARIHYDYFGEGKKDVVVLLNGLAMSTVSWYRSVADLQAEFDVLLYDYLGQGQSTDDDMPYYINRFADYLAMIMDKLEIDRVHTMGVSYGGFIAADFGRLHQDRLHTQTLSGILLSHEASFEFYQQLSLEFYHAGPKAFELYTGYLFEKTFGELFLRKVYPRLDKMRADFAALYAHRPHCLIRLTEAQNPFFGALDEHLAGYRACNTPTLIISGEDDRAIPVWMQVKLSDIYPNNNMLLLPDCGHLVYAERPDLFWPNLRAFIRAKSIRFKTEGSVKSTRTEKKVA